jgi:photosystem II stability/assembly factor-like uncharacterized protein
LKRVVIGCVLAAAYARADEGAQSLHPTAARAASWRLTSTALFDVKVTAIAVDPSDPNTIYVGGVAGVHFGQHAVLFRSDDAGVTWRQLENGLTGGLSVTTLLIDPANPDVVYAAIYGRGVYKSVDRGENWTLVNASSTPWIYSLVIDPRNPDTLYVAVAAEGVYKTTNAGSTWTLVSGGLGIQRTVFIVSLLLDPADSTRLYAVSTAHELHRSDDAGGSWHSVRTGIAALLWIDPTNSAVLYALQDDGALLKSVDRGLNWTRIGAGLPPNASAGSLRGDPRDPSILYAASFGAGVFRSTDGGLTWTAVNEGLANLSVGGLLAPPTGDPLLYVGTDTGLFDYRARAEFQITLPALASLHGLPPTFFHSDVWIFNGSTEREAAVTATYRCAQEGCGSSVQTFTIPPRQTRFFPDIVGTLFAAPETFGAIEFESAELVVVTSRLYTPDRSAPTVGMFVPGLALSEAHVTSVLTSLSHDSFFRTNVGVYNLNDVGQRLTFQFFSASGGLLGEIIDFVGPRQSRQINDPEIFDRIAVAGDVSDFYAIVTGDGVHPLHAYASVIDRHSQDPIFVPGADGSGALVAKTTLPAVAHVQGVGNSFFKSDVKIWNASTEGFANVTARFPCFEGDCGERVFTVAPRQMLAWDDVVTSLFHSISAGGAMEFVSDLPIVITSRLYTPTLIESTYGMFVPGFPPEASSPAVVLNGLSHPTDFSTGSRVNVGVFNQADVAQVVTYRLFDGSGNQIGQASRFFAPREFFQVNDVFASMNVSQSLESAYCLVEGSELFPLFAYAAVIDNRSQDPIFIPGEDDPEHPPIVPFSR